MSRETQLFLSNGLMLDATEFEFSFVRSSGPGGQNVNKVASGGGAALGPAQAASTCPMAVRMRLEALAGSRLTDDGVLIIQAQRHRTQERNRADAVERLIALVRAGPVSAQAPQEDQTHQRLEAPAPGWQETPGR